MDQETFQKQFNLLTGTRLDRRRFLRLSLASLGITALPLLSACGSDDSEDEPEVDAGADATPSTPPAADQPATPADDVEADASPATENTPTTSDSSGGTSGGEVSVLWKSPTTLSPLFSTAGSEQQIERLIFGSLVKMSDTLEPTPDMAASIEVSDDAAIYTFKLHDNIVFSDGESLTAEDVIFTLESAIDKRSTSYWLGRLNGIAGANEFSEQAADTVSGLAMPDEHTVEITLAEPEAAFLVTLCNFSGLGILPKHVLADVAPDQLREHPFSLAPTVSAGPFKFVRYETDQYLEVERHDGYWGDPPPLDRIFLRILTPEVGVAQLETGEIDLMTLPVAEIEHTKQMANAHVESVPSPSMTSLSPNMTLDYLSNKRVLQAIMHAVDRQGILDSVYMGEGEILNSPIFGPEWMGVPEGLNEYPYDPDKAKSLLEEASWDFDREVEMIHTPGNKETDTTVAIIQEQLREVGFQMAILQVDSAENNRRSVQSTDFELKMSGGGVYRADPGVSGSYVTTDTWSPAGGNYGHYSNKKIDELYPEAKAAADVEERKKLYTEIAQILNDELPKVPLFSPNSIYGVSNRLQGYEPASYIDNKFWNAETWSVSE